MNSFNCPNCNAVIATSVVAPVNGIAQTTTGQQPSPGVAPTGSGSAPVVLGGVTGTRLSAPSGTTGSMRTATVTTAPVVPVGPVTGYPATRVTLDDAMFLTKLSLAYQEALKSLPGTHQLFFDILVRADGRRWSDGVPQPAGTANDPGLKLEINTAINLAGEENAALTARYDPASYAGPLRVIYLNLVAAKLAGHF